MVKDFWSHFYNVHGLGGNNMWYVIIKVIIKGTSTDNIRDAIVSKTSISKLFILICIITLFIISIFYKLLINECDKSGWIFNPLGEPLTFSSV